MVPSLKGPGELTLVELWLVSTASLFAYGTDGY